MFPKRTTDQTSELLCFLAPEIKEGVKEHLTAVKEERIVT